MIEPNESIIVLALIIAIIILALVIGIMMFYVGVVSCMYIITGPGQTRTLKHPVSKNIYFKISYSRSENGVGVFRIGITKK